MRSSLVALALLTGCCSAPQVWIRDGYETTTYESARGVSVVFLTVLADHHQDTVEDVLGLVDSTVPDSDPRIPPGSVGVPLGYTVTVKQSGAFPSSNSPTGFALGKTDMRENIWVALKHGDYGNVGQLLPALAHELRHVYTQDPKAGH